MPVMKSYKFQVKDRTSIELRRIAGYLFQIILDESTMIVTMDLVARENSVLKQEHIRDLGNRVKILFLPIEKSARKI